MFEPLASFPTQQQPTMFQPCVQQMLANILLDGSVGCAAKRPNIVDQYLLDGIARRMAET